MFCEDLGKSAYFASGDNIRAVGWLEVDYPFARGPIDARFWDVLKSHVATAYQPFIFMGCHTCSLCSVENARARGHYNLLIPTADLLYVAPELIIHYIDCHGYQPPSEFLTAVLDCPQQGSAEFLKMLEPFAAGLRGGLCDM